MLKHLEDREGELDYINLQQLKKEKYAPWDTNEHIVKYFTKVDRAVKRAKDKIKVDDKELLTNVLYTIKESGEMEWALKKGNKRPRQIRHGRSGILF